jgi:hypothetical protein
VKAYLKTKIIEPPRRQRTFKYKIVFILVVLLNAFECLLAVREHWRLTTDDRRFLKKRKSFTAKVRITKPEPKPSPPRTAPRLESGYGVRNAKVASCMRAWRLPLRAETLSLILLLFSSRQSF